MNEVKKIVILSSPKEPDIINVLDYGESTLQGFIDRAQLECMEFGESTSSIGNKVAVRDSVNEASIAQAS